MSNIMLCLYPELSLMENSTWNNLSDGLKDRVCSEIQGRKTGEEGSMYFNLDTIDIEGAEEVVAITYEMDEVIEHTYKNDKMIISIPQKDVIYYKDK